MEIEVILTATGLGLISISVWFAGRQLRLNRKMSTLEYVSNQFDRLAQLGCRQELKAMGNQNILGYIAGNPIKRQTLLEYIYTCNRIGAGIFKKALREDIIFNVWSPKWFERRWETFEPLVTQERTERGEEASGAYVFFDWLAKEKCPKVREKYPEKPATTAIPRT